MVESVKNNDKDSKPSKFLFLSVEIDSSIYTNAMNKILGSMCALLEDEEASAKCLSEILFLFGKVSEEKPKFKFPNDFHITTYFKKDKQFTTNQAYKEFLLHKDISIDILCVVFLPGTALIAVVDCDCYVNNKVPHITSAVAGDFKPKESNDVCEVLFVSKQSDLKNDFDSKFIDYEETIVLKREIEVLGKSHKALIYVYGRNDRLNLTGKMNYH